MVILVENEIPKLSKDLVDAHKHLFKNLKIISKYRMASIIDKLTTIDIAGNYSVMAKRLGIGDREFRKFIGRARKNDLGFTINIDYPSIGLTQLRIFIPRIINLNNIPMKPWLKLYSITYNPIGVSLVYYMPYTLRKDFLRRLDNELKSLEIDGEFELKVIHKSFKIQPRLVSLKISELFRFNISQWLKELSKIETYTLGMHTPIYTQDFHDPYDAIDLLILRELEHDAFTTVFDLAEKYPFSPKVFMKHIKIHIKPRKTINGIYLKPKFISRQSNHFINIDLRITQRQYAVLLSLFKKMPWTTYVSLCSDISLSTENLYDISEAISILVTMILPVNVLNGLLVFLEHLRESGFVYKVKVYNHDPLSIKRFGIPYSNFDQEMRSWTLDVERSYRLLKNRILRYIKNTG